MVPGLHPHEANERLKKYKEKTDVNIRQYEILNDGETLFGLPHTL